MQHAGPTHPGAPRAPQSVLFVCNHNVIRSPMAAALLKLRFGKTMYVESCGVRAGGEPDPFVVAVMDELGADLSRHRPRALADLDDWGFDLVVTLAPEAHHRVLEMTRSLALEVEYWPTYDPSDEIGGREQILAAYRAARDGLAARIDARFTRASTAGG